MLPITKKIIPYNFSKGNMIKFLVIHDTGNTQPGADAKSHYLFFGGGNRSSSAHYFVDDKSIWQIIEDYNCSWHCGDGRGRYGITNQNSIGIEICIHADGDYKKSLRNTTELAAYLMKKYAIPIDRVVRHFDASRKCCPGKMSPDGWSGWFRFKEDIRRCFTSEISVSQQVGTVISNALNIRKGAGTGYEVLGILNKGTSVQLDKKVGDWYAIHVNGQQGFIHAQYVQLNS